MTYSFQGKRIFIKDMAYYLCPLEGPASIAPSLGKIKRGVGTDDHVNGVNGVETFPNGIHPTGEDDSVKATHAATGALPNPTVFPEDVLNRFHFAFLIRHPSKALPSYYRCMVPPLVEMTGFSSDHPLEAGYCELRLVFDYLRSIGQVGPAMAGSQEEQGSGSAHIEICVVDADDMLEDPSGFIETFCNSVGVQYKPEMLKWDTHGDQEHARKAFAKWKGFHEDALDSEGLTAKTHVSHFIPLHKQDADELPHRRSQPRPSIKSMRDGSTSTGRRLLTASARMWRRALMTIII